MLQIIFKAVFVLSLCCFSINLSAQNIEETIKGLWLIGDTDNSKVDFSLTEDGLWQGIITETEVERSVGKLLFKEGIYDAKENKIVGVLIHPDSGFGVSGTLTLESEKKLHVLAKKFFITKEFLWKRL